MPKFEELPTSSETTGLRRLGNVAERLTGPQRGETGSVVTATTGKRTARQLPAVQPGEERAAGRRIEQCLPERVVQLKLTDKRPPILTTQEADTMRVAANLLRELLSPVQNIQAVISRITALLAHYYTPDLGEDLWALVTHDWSQALKPYPGWAIAQACQHWRDAEPSRRPTPGAIVQECGRLTKHHRLLLDSLDADLRFFDAHGGLDGAMGKGARLDQWRGGLPGMDMESSPGADLLEQGLVEAVTVYRLTDEGQRLLQAFRERGHAR